MCRPHVDPPACSFLPRKAACAVGGGAMSASRPSTRGPLRSHAGLRRGLKRVDKSVRRCLRTGLLRLLGPPEPVAADRLEGVGKILLIRTNFRIGNVLVAAPLIHVFRERFPAARVDALVADTTASLLQEQPVGTVFTVSRSFVARPWRIVSLIRRLRRERYDLAVQVTPGSFSGALVTRLTGARYTMGRGGDGSDYNVAVTAPTRHAHDTPVPFAQALGVAPRNCPSFRTAAAERQQARELLRRFGFPRDHGRFVGLFIGGHLDKRWPLSAWTELCRSLDAGGVRFLAFLGPEEAELAPQLQATLASCASGALVEPRPLRQFAALLGEAELLVTPDSGPMHLAAALDVPTIAIVRRPVSLKYVPRGAGHRSLRDPSPEGVYHAVLRARLARSGAPPLGVIGARRNPVPTDRAAAGARGGRADAG